MGALNLSAVCRSGRFWLALSVAVLSGCTSTMAARVTSFQQWPAGVEGQRYQFVQSNADQSNNLEYRAYQDMVRAAIGATGLVEATSGAKPRFNVVFDYGARATQVVTRQPADPYFYGGGFGCGYYGRGGYGYGRWGYPGYWGPAYVDVPVQAFRNELNLRILDTAASNAEVYRSSAVALSGQPDLIGTMPVLVRAIFDNFPGNNGSERVIRYQME